MTRLPLRQHQVDDINWIANTGRGLLGNEPGLGKSRSAIEAFDGGNNLIIAPNLVLEGETWSTELDLWSDHPDGWSTASYSRLNDRKRTGHGSGSRPVNRLRPEFRQRYDCVVVDEAHYIKGRKTSWTWATSQICQSADAVLLMTGTPMPNWAHELFTLLQVLYPEESKRGRKYGSFWRWAEQWFDTTPTRFSNGNPVVGEMLACDESCEARPKYDPCEHYHRFVQDNLGNKFRRVLRDDCLDLPPFTRQVVQTPMSAEQKRIYRELKKDFMAELTDGTEAVAWSTAARHVMLDRVTTSAYTLNPDGKPKGGKLDMLREDLGNRSRPTLVFAHYRTSVDAAVEVARQAGATAEGIHGGVSSRDRTRIIMQFKTGKLDVLVGSLETLAEGLTLTAADMAIFLEMSYKPSRNEQATYRIHRMGQTRPVTIREYVTPGTIDERKRRLLEAKTDQQMRVLTAAQVAQLL